MAFSPISPYSRMRNLIKHTSYVNLEALGRPDIYLKLETEQFGNSFKSRGIVEYLSHIKNITGLVTFTTGNHGIAVAKIAQILGVECLIISTPTLTSYKRLLIESYNAKINTFESNNSTAAIDYAKNIAENVGYIFVPLYNDENLLAGYSGITDEICNDLIGDLTLYFPIGSGSLLLANARAAKTTKRHIKVIGVEPSVYQRFDKSGSMHSISKSIADSLSIDKIPAGNLAALHYIDGLVTICEDDIIISLNLLYTQLNLIVEPGAAICLAAALQSPIDENKKIVILTGCNISEKELKNLINSETHAVDIIKR
jgi:threonine dehydratase